MLTLLCSRRARFLSLAWFIFAALDTAQGGSATWNLSPSNGDWNTAANWTPMTVPNGSSDAATFDMSSQTSVGVSAQTVVGSVLFTSGAPAYTISVQPATLFTISGSGIENQSTAVSTFTEVPGEFGTRPGILRFFGSASAGTAKIITPGGDQFAIGGNTIFADRATAGNADLVATGVQGAGGQAGILLFQGHSDAGASTVTAEGGANGDAVSGAIVSLSQSASAGSATLTSEGAAVLGAFGSEIQFSGRSTAAQSTLIATGRLGIGGSIEFFGDSSGGAARLELFDLGGLGIDFHSAPGVTVGSIEGNGTVFLGPNILTVGSNDLSTTFSGLIEDEGAGGGLTKIGVGSLSLRATNSYGGGTTIRSGTLFIDSQEGSGTGSGSVIVAGGTLGGRGIIAGPVTVGATGGQAGRLEPGSIGQPLAELLIQSDVSFSDHGSLTIELDPQTGAVDQLTTNGATISAGARIRILSRSGVFNLGTTLIVISNTSANPIIGTFGNLPDGGIVTLNGNNFQASYEGGDGNDLTLTVIP